jgi:hypothetical protein
MGLRSRLYTDRETGEVFVFGIGVSRLVVVGCAVTTLTPRPPLPPALVVPHIAFCLLAFAGDNFRGRTGLYRATANDLPLLLLNQESFNSWMVS